MTMGHDNYATTVDDLALRLFGSRTPPMAEIARLVRTAMDHPVAVLLSGASGTGKERVARAIHHGSERAERPFIAVNCGALTETLLEAELFGHRQGAYTGAIADRAGLFEAAAGGTLFLDEIGEASPALQIKLLHTLESGEVMAVGATQMQRIDVRVIAATHRDLEVEMGHNRFRSDLYYRINTLPISLPPLAQRRDDIAQLARHSLDEVCRRLHKRVAGLTKHAVTCLQRYDWPGNLRELHNEIARAVALAAAGQAIDADMLSPKVRHGGASPRGAVTTLRRARCAFEESYIREVLERHSGNAATAAKTLGISRSMLQRKIRNYGLRDKMGR